MQDNSIHTNSFQPSSSSLNLRGKTENVPRRKSRLSAEILNDSDRQRWRLCVSVTSSLYQEDSNLNFFFLPTIYSVFTPCLSLYLLPLTNLFLFRPTLTLVAPAHQICFITAKDKTDGFWTRARFRIWDYRGTRLTYILHPLVEARSYLWKVDLTLQCFIS